MADYRFRCLLCDPDRNEVFETEQLTVGDARAIDAHLTDFHKARHDLDLVEIIDPNGQPVNPR